MQHLVKHNTFTKNVCISKVKLLNFSRLPDDETDSSNLSDEETGWFINYLSTFPCNLCYKFIFMEI